MGLLSIIRKIKMKEREMRILILGLDNAGKVEFCFCFFCPPHGCYFRQLLLSDSMEKTPVL